MELKFDTNTKNIWAQSVLIVPLWNWNEEFKKMMAEYNDSSNRTFMELKLKNWMRVQR